MTCPAAKPAPASDDLRRRARHDSDLVEPHSCCRGMLAIQFGAITTGGDGADAYAGFALQDSRSRILRVEMLGGTGVRGRFSRRIVASRLSRYRRLTYSTRFGDMLHHRGRVISTGVPGWYIPFCLCSTCSPPAACSHCAL